MPESADARESSPDAARAEQPVRRAPKEPVLPAVSDRERYGWGEDGDDGRRDEDWYRRERPPHHE